MDELHLAQIVSLGFSVLATAFIGAQTNRLLDTNVRMRTSDPIMCGFYPRVGKDTQLPKLLGLDRIVAECMEELQLAA
jgi:hypothetical protein